MRANSPVDDYDITQPVTDDKPPIDRLTKEMKELAAASRSKQGRIILDYLRQRADDYTEVLKSTNFAEQDAKQTAIQVMAAQAVIREFESVLRDVDISNKAVNDATEQS